MPASSSFSQLPSHGQGTNQSGPAAHEDHEGPEGTEGHEGDEGHAIMKAMKATKAMKAMPMKAMKAMKATMKATKPTPREEKPKPWIDLPDHITWRLVLPCSQKNCGSWIFYRHYLNETWPSCTICGMSWSKSALAGPKYNHNYKYQLLYRQASRLLV